MFIEDNNTKKKLLEIKRSRDVTRAPNLAATFPLIINSLLISPCFFFFVVVCVCASLHYQIINHKDN